ncbi:zinc finger protein [Pimephales promelas]|nr:zinc finger protein [Pimephales promelas]
MGVHDNEGCNITICKTISCLLPLDLEVKQACQLTEFLTNPSLDSYYAVETLFNEPDQKLEQEDPPILNSLRCDLLLALKTKWPFDPEFWDWKTLKRQCLALMGQEATAILSTDKCTDSEDNEVHNHDEKYFQDLHFTNSPTYELSEVEAERKKKREMKKMREMGFVSARFRNWQAYMQYCVLCDKEFLGHRIVKHALKHVQDGIFRCPICAKTFETRVVLEPHVASHVKQSCKERLAAMGVSKKRTSIDTKLTAASSAVKKEEHDSKTAVEAQCAYPNCERIFNETYLLYDHEAQHYITFSCKSQNCDKVFYTLSELDLHQKGHAKKKGHSAVDGGSPSQLEVLTPTFPALELPPSQMNEVSQEFTPVERKHTVESIIDNVQDSTEQPEHLVPCTAQLTVSKNYSLTTNAVQPDESKTPHCFESTKQLHLESCFVKLEPIPIKCNDPKYIDALKNADSETQTLLKDKKLFSFTLRQLKLSTLKSSRSVKKANKEEGLTHVCPFETCTRKYSTSKSLSRHVKNVHSEAFEEWKLSKKYKRIAEIAAKKSAESTTTSSQIAKWTSRSRQTEHTTFLDSVLESTSSIFSNHDSMQSISAKFCSQLENPQSVALPNQTDLMQFPITQTWAAPPMENLDSGFSVLPYSSTILSDNQHTNPSYHSDTVLDYASPSSYDDINPLSVNANTPSSVMNEASKYVSSSLRVLHAFNSEQTCDLSQVESSVNPGFSQIGQNHPGRCRAALPRPVTSFSPALMAMGSDPCAKFQEFSRMLRPPKMPEKSHTANKGLKLT